MPLDLKPLKVIASRGERNIRYRYSGDKIQITVFGCCSATEQAIPPFVISAAKRLNHLWTKRELPGTRYGLSDCGWTDCGPFIVSYSQTLHPMNERGKGSGVSPIHDLFPTTRFLRTNQIARRWHN